VLDLHLHILADVDDGPTDREESEAMLHLAASLGFTELVATPHLKEPLESRYARRVDDERAWLTTVADDLGIALRAGFEIRLSPDTARQLEAGDPITLAGSRTALVELPFVGWPVFTDQALFDIMAAGFRPLLAHPERYAAVLENPRLVYALRERGILLQLTTGSLAGLFGRRSREVAEQLLLDGIVDVLASDSHSAGRRFVSVAEGVARAVELVGDERVQQLTEANPAALLTDQPLPSPVIASPSTNGGPKWRQSLTRVRHLIPGR
jgi:protein-tyrosine phosphatase